ncbi:hypothetical protein DSO57_1035638 [Entomophthora muscae]|uniref:Uncharacterized protein n=1 Tax=Entomophthora muscae TaxID=34485 RepID=A0ACC2RQN8_9FUNG|nr:hypothetical protein DSO57_1035638 [Entomophthora muscae]
MSTFMSSSAPAPVPNPAQAAHQPTNQDGNLDSEQLSATTQPAPYSQSGFSSPGPVPQATNHHHLNSSVNYDTKPTGSAMGPDCRPVSIYPSYFHVGFQQPDEQGESDWDGQEAQEGP